MHYCVYMQAHTFTFGSACSFLDAASKYLNIVIN